MAMVEFAIIHTPPFQEDGNLCSLIDSCETEIINPRRACAARVTVLSLCVCVCVCVSVTQHFTFHVFIRATNDTNLLGGG